MFTISRIRRLAATALAVAPVTAAALLVASGAQAQPATGPLTTHPAYHHVSWRITAGDPDGGSLSVDAPHAWSFTRTPAGQGRFHGAGGTWLLSVGIDGDNRSPQREVASRKTELVGTPGLRIIATTVTHDKALDDVVGTIAYRYTDPSGQVRRVTTRYLSFGDRKSTPATLELTVAGRPEDRAGIRAVMARATSSVELAD